ncbi:MAG: acetoacetyl-CoA reductase [Magnetococcales bacterium]|nr:acetoacetyl-CoA reductase [Magnetococcales bacterium]
MTQRTALVTGGAGGIGTEITRGLIKAGYKVAATCTVIECQRIDDWRAARKAEDMDIPLFEVDVTDFYSCKKMIDDVESQVGPIDVLINNAGITRDSTLKKMTPEQWDAVINTNLDGAFNMTRQVWPGMLDRKFGRIINISSINGRKGQFGQANYSASKAGLHGFTMALAQEGARKGVTVNTISPGYTATKMMLDIPKEILDAIIAQIPAGRLAEPIEIARVALFLAADDAGFITGANIDVNGGQFIH